jgi:putative transposase
LATVPAQAQAELKAAYWAIFDLDEHVESGQGAVDIVQRRIDAFAAKYGKRYPAAVRCLLADREQLTTYLRFPREHHHRIRHSNFIERTFGDPPPGQGDRPVARRGQLPVLGLGRARPAPPVGGAA